MASSRRITKLRVDRLEPGSALWDSGSARLRLFGASGGMLCFILKYRAGGKQRLYTIGLQGSPWTGGTGLRTEAQRLLGEGCQGHRPVGVARQDEGGADP